MDVPPLTAAGRARTLYESFWGLAWRTLEYPIWRRKPLTPNFFNLPAA
jgi:hypothetical protein